MNPKGAVSLAEVAQNAGVSIGTVSHVLNHPGRVKESTRRRVEDAIESLGFVRNSNASNLARRGNQTIGFVAIDISNSLFVDMARSAQKRAHSEGMSLLLGNSDNDEDLQERHLDFFNSSRVSGILLAPMRDPRAAMQRVQRLGTPVVVLNYDWDDADHCAVVVNNEAAGHLAARHMIEMGRRHIAFVGGKDEYQPVRDRRAGVRRAVSNAVEGIRLTEIPVTDLDSAGGEYAGQLVARMPEEDRPDAVIAVTDMLGMSIIQCLSRHSIDIPGTVAVMGCDYNVNAWGGAVPLTSVKMHGQEMGAAAFSLLLEEIEDPGHQHRRIVVEPSLVIRQSTTASNG